MAAAQRDRKPGSQEQLSYLLTSEECRRQRTRLGLTQAHLARLAKVQGHTIWAFENGRSTPHRNTVWRIKKALQEVYLEQVQRPFFDEPFPGLGAIDPHKHVINRGGRWYYSRGYPGDVAVAYKADRFRMALRTAEYARAAAAAPAARDLFDRIVEAAREALQNPEPEKLAEITKRVRAKMQKEG